MAVEEMIQATEKLVDLAEEGIDDVVDVIEIVKNNPIVLAAVGVAGLVAGAAGGYFVAYKRLSSKFEEDLAYEIDATRRFYSRANKVGDDGEPLTPMDVAEEAGIAVRRYQGRVDEGPVHETIEEAKEAQGGPSDDAMDETQIQRLERALRERGVEPAEVKEISGDYVTYEAPPEKNVFEDSSFDLEIEKELRTPEEPYIVTHDEFFENEFEFDQSKLTYFDEDGVLVDEHSNPLEEYESLVGGDHLLRFGSGSNDRNTVYVRNEKVEVEWEIVRSTGSYVKEVLGLENNEPDTLKHSNRNAQQRRRREFRHGDG